MRRGDSDNLHVGWRGEGIVLNGPELVPTQIGFQLDCFVPERGLGIAVWPSGLVSVAYSAEYIRRLRYRGLRNGQGFPLGTNVRPSPPREEPPAEPVVIAL